MGGPYVLFGSFVYVESILFELGAVLGRSRKNELVDLVRMFTHLFTDPTQVEGNARYLQQEGMARLSRFGGEPTSFQELISTTTLASAGLSFQGEWNRVKKALEEKWPLSTVETFTKVAVMHGIGFGAVLPDLTERLYRDTHEHPDPNEWKKWHDRGLDVPSAPTIMALEEYEDVLLRLVAVYAQRFFPSLVAALYLTDLVDPSGRVPPPWTI